MSYWDKHVSSLMTRAADQIEKDGQLLEGKREIGSAHDQEMRKQLVLSLRAAVETIKETPK